MTVDEVAEATVSELGLRDGLRDELKEVESVKIMPDIDKDLHNMTNDIRARVDCFLSNIENNEISLDEAKEIISYHLNQIINDLSSYPEEEIPF